MNASQKHRALKRSADEAGFLARNNEQQRRWRAENPHMVALANIKRKTSVKSKWSDLKKSAKQRNIYLNEDDREELQEMMKQPCHYCGFDPPEGERLNGIDRVDSQQGYFTKNAVPACALCNFMKMRYDIQSFIAKIRKIFEHGGKAMTYNDDYRPTYSGICSIKKGTKNDKTDHLNNEEKRILKSKPCYLCGQEKAGGIDRVDPHRGYETDNAMPCDKVCNYLKKDMTLGQFFAHIVQIYWFSRHWVMQA